MTEYTQTQAQEIVNQISFAPSGIQMHETGNPQFEVQKTEYGFMIRCSFWRPDTNTGEMGTGFGRWWIAPLDSQDKGLVMAAWMAFEQIVKHEMMECFLYKGARLFNPHKTLEELAHPEIINKKTSWVKKSLARIENLFTSKIPNTPESI